jgi:hypothetical protein
MSLRLVEIRPRPMASIRPLGQEARPLCMVLMIGWAPVPPICCLSFLKCFRILCRLVSEGHSIPTEPGHPPPFRSMYRLSPLEYRELEKQVTKFLKDGILEVSQSPYGATVLFVPKPNGRGLRLCVDYRALNSIIVKNRCTIPRIDDLLDAVAGSQYFTSLDLTSGYHQILISEEERPKTAFRTPFGHFQFKVLIEDLTNAPQPLFRR